MDFEIVLEKKEYKKVTAEQLEFINRVYVSRGRRNPVYFMRRTKRHDFIKELMEKYEKAQERKEQLEQQKDKCADGQPMASSTQKDNVDEGQEGNLHALWSEVKGKLNF